MDFQDFLNNSPKIRKINLPGEAAHEKLAPRFRVQELQKMEIEQRNPRHAAVLAVFYPGRNNQTYFILILRKTYPGVHSNQIGFPGGRVEKADRNLEQTAIRETEEEVGIPAGEIEILAKITPLYIPPSNFWVQPFLGYTRATPELIPQEEEVEAILEVNLDDLLHDSCLTTRSLSTSYAKEVEVPAFLLEGQVVWGATAMMLSEMKEILRRAL